PAVEPDPAALERYVPDGQFFLYVGSAYPYKNLARLIEAFAHVGDEYRLVLAGDHENLGAALTQQASALGLADRVIFTGPVSETELATLYAGAAAYAFVSLSEGFGLPGL